MTRSAFPRPRGSKKHLDLRGVELTRFAFPRPRTKVFFKVSIVTSIIICLIFIFPPPALLQKNKQASCDWVGYVSYNNMFNVYVFTAGIVTTNKQPSDWVDAEENILISEWLS